MEGVAEFILAQIKDWTAPAWVVTMSVKFTVQSINLINIIFP